MARENDENEIDYSIEDYAEGAQEPAPQEAEDEGDVEEDDGADVEGADGEAEADAAAKLASEPEERARARKEWRFVNEYFAEVRRILESARGRAAQTAAIAGVHASSPGSAIAAYATDADLLVVLVPGSHEYAKKDAAYGELVRLLKEAPADGLWALVVRGMMPRIIGLARQRTKALHPQAIEEECGRVLTAFAEVVRAFPLDRLPRKIDVNLYWRTRRRLERQDRGTRRADGARRELVQEFRWIVGEEQRGAGSPAGLLDTILEDQEDAAPYAEDEAEDAMALLRTLRLAKNRPLSELDCRLLVQVDVCGRTEAEVAREVGLSLAAVKSRRDYARKRIVRFCPELRDRLSPDET